MGSFGCMTERIVSKEVKTALWDNIMVLTVTYASEMWNKNQRYKIQAVKISYLRCDACGVRRMDVKSNGMCE